MVAPQTTNIPGLTTTNNNGPAARASSNERRSAAHTIYQHPNRLEEVEPSPPPTIFPNATRPSNANDRTSPPAGVLLPNLPPRSNDAIVHPPRMRANQGRAQRERGFVYPGAYQQGPLRSTTRTREGAREQHLQGWRSEVSGRGWRRQHPSPADA